MNYQTMLENTVNVEQVSDSKELYPEYEYIALDDILDAPMYLVDVTPYENKNGPGVAGLITDGQGSFVKIVTHSKVLVATFTNQKTADTLASGSAVKFTVYKKKSSTSGMTMYALR